MIEEDFFSFLKYQQQLQAQKITGYQFPDTYHLYRKPVIELENRSQIQGYPESVDNYRRQRRQQNIWVFTEKPVRNDYQRNHPGTGNR